MSAEQVAINHRALRNVAAELERIGYTGDALRLAESLALSLIYDGYRVIPKSPPPTGRGSSDAARRALVEKTKRELADRKRERTAMDPSTDTACPRSP